MEAPGRPMVVSRTWQVMGEGVVAMMSSCGVLEGGGGGVGDGRMVKRKQWRGCGVALQRWRMIWSSSSESMLLTA
jgi:hypothetical protein